MILITLNLNGKENERIRFTLAITIFSQSNATYVSTNFKNLFCIFFVSLCK
jgi:hypothetical protein